jgi:hypothetical protein
LQGFSNGEKTLGEVKDTQAVLTAAEKREGTVRNVSGREPHWKVMVSGLFTSRKQVQQCQGARLDLPQGFHG